ncbi:MAG: hypothetical protein ABJC63_08205 [Gemmatimonadales bacterium]
MSGALTNRAEEIDRLTAAVFGSLLSFGLAAIYFLLRIGFADPLRPIVVTLGLALFVICVPSVLSDWLNRRHDRQKWWLSQSLLGILCIALSALAGAIAYPTHVNLGVPIAIAGAASFVVVLFRWIRRSRAISLLVVAVMLVMFTAWVAGVAWGTRFKTPLFWELLSDRGNVHHDPLYYASMANSMRAYGVPSSGLDGVPYTPYHYGSAWLNSEWVDLAGVDVLTFYSLGPTVLVAPVFFAALLLFAGEARVAWRKKRPDDEPASIPKPIQEDWIAWLAFVGATIGFVPTAALDAVGVWNRHLLISESYLTGLCVFVLGAAMSVVWWTGRKENARGDAWFMLLVVPVLLISLGFLKVSLMLLALVALLWTVLRTGLLRSRLFLIGSIAALVVSAITFKLVWVAAQNQGIAPFNYMRYYNDDRWWPYFFLVHLFWSLLYVTIRIREENLPAMSDLFSALRVGRLLDAEIVAVVAVCGFIPGELINIHGGSAFYFSDVQRWVAAPLVMAVAARWTWERSRAGHQGGIQSIRLSTIAAVLIAIPVGITILFNVGRAVRGAEIMNVGLREAFYSYAGVESFGAAHVHDPQVLAAGLQKAPDYEMISALRALDAEPRELKRKTLLFVPQSDSSFWNIFGEPLRCSFAPMVGPATSGLALLDGMPPTSCNRSDQYGLTAYPRRTKPQTPEDVTPAALCTKARRKGFKRVIVLEPTGNGRYTTPAIDC